MGLNLELKMVCDPVLIKKVPTRYLLSLYRKCRRIIKSTTLSGELQDPEDEWFQDIKKYSDILSKELDTREHIPSPKERKLLRQMKARLKR
jgi:hypothetical protein